MEYNKDSAYRNGCVRYLMGSRYNDDHTKMCIADGWWYLYFYSDYFGNHPESGEGVEIMEFLFHPSIPTKWQGTSFQHGHHGGGDTYEEFMKWLEAIPEHLVNVL